MLKSITHEKCNKVKVSNVQQYLQKSPFWQIHPHFIIDFLLDK